MPEDRKRQGLVMTMTCQENLTLTLLDRLRRWIFLDRHAQRRIAREYIDRLHVRTPHLDTPIADLSGGNQQKIVLAKWLARRSKVLMLDEPTRGVDIGAKAEIHRLIDQLAARGHGMVLISSELPEMLSLSTRILVLREGRLVGELARHDATEEKLMRLMAGIRAA